MLFEFDHRLVTFTFSPIWMRGHPQHQNDAFSLDPENVGLDPIHQIATASQHNGFAETRLDQAIGYRCLVKQMNGIFSLPVWSTTPTLVGRSNHTDVHFR